MELKTQNSDGKGGIRIPHAALEAFEPVQVAGLFS